MEIISNLVELDTKKNTLLIAIGGGITQDVSCFVASVLYRGIDWYFVPTTLLAQTDSCIGSKSSINYKDYKNLIGTFYPPISIIIHPQFVWTLTQRDYFSGLGEIAKIAAMNGRDGFYAFRGNLPAILEKDEPALRAEIEKTLFFKKGIIEIDEFDRDYRNILNYGHTFSHAFEAESHFLIPHGQAVTLGCMVANEISLSRGLIPEQYRDDMRDTFAEIISRELLSAKLFDGQKIIPIMRKDKKYTGNAHTCILVDEQEAKKYNDVNDVEIENALERTKMFWGL